MGEILRSERLGWIWRGLNVVLLCCGVGATGLLVLELLQYGSYGWLQKATAALVLAFAGQEFARVALVCRPWRYVQRRWLELSLAALGGAASLLGESIPQGLRLAFPWLTVEWLVLGYLILMQGAVLGGILVRTVRHHAVIGRMEIHPGLLLLGSFVLLSLLGTGLLSLPVATVGGIRTIDAAFTATSAVCVTGLTVVDTATVFTSFGHFVLLGLIQLGGLGLMTFMSFFGMLFTAGLGVRERLLLGEVFAVESLAEVRRLLGYVVVLTLSIELVGACILYWSDGGGWPLDGQRAFRALFHAVSAFCNAGFALYSENLVAQQHNVSYLGVIMGLVVLGGLGFPVLSALLGIRPWRSPLQRLQHRLPLAARLVLSTTGVLLVGGTVLLWVLERHGVFRNFPLWEQFFQALFLAVVPRTAGFNSVPIEELSAPASLVVIGLMWIGASPASTGGGVKTLTVAVAVVGIVQLLSGRGRVEVFHREIPLESVLKAFVAIAVSAAFLLTSALILQLLEPGCLWLDVLFETASALGTVGLSRGITAELSAGAKLLLCLVMLIGRIGVLTAFSLLLPARPSLRYRYPQERVIIT